MIVGEFDDLDNSIINTSSLNSNEVESLWYKSHTIILTSLLAFHTVFSLILLFMLLFSIISSDTYTVCGKYSEISITSYFLLNLGFSFLYFLNYRNAKEMDVVLLKRTRNLLLLLFFIAPVLFIGIFTPGVLCGDGVNKDDIIISTTKIVAHLMFESFIIGMYFAFYLRHVLNKELFTKPYDTGIKL